MSIELAIKSEHLALEPAIIRKYENKLLKVIRYRRDNKENYLPALNKYCILQQHRLQDVRNESRATFLARAFINKTPYRVVENKTKEPLLENWQFKYKVFPRIVDMVNKYQSPEKTETTELKNKWYRPLITHKDVLAWLELPEDSLNYNYDRITSGHQREKVKAAMNGELVG